MNLLVTGAFARNEDDLDAFKRGGHEVVFLKQERDELPCDASWVEGIIGNGIFLSHPIERFTSLKYIQLTSAGFDRVPMDYVKEKGIKIFNARGVYSAPMAEFAVCGVLDLYKKSRFFYDNQREHKWIKHRDVLELGGKTVCVVGCGSVGTECAKRFSAFGCKIIGVDANIYESKFYEKMLPLSEMDSALGKSDIVILTLPLTDDTRYLMNNERFSAMKEGSVLVNIARGAVVKTDDMISALENRLYGAVLDVFEDEPLSESSPLWGLENVILTPHNSFIGEGNFERLSSLVYKNIL